MEPEDPLITRLDQVYTSIDGVKLTPGDRILIKGLPYKDHPRWKRILHRLHLRPLRYSNVSQNGVYMVMESSQPERISDGENST